MTRAQFLFLGTGGSAGVPLIGCSCPVCTSSDSRNRRLRPSGLLKIGEKKIVIDTGPDFRQQALSYGVSELDGVIITHSHFDHIGGLDELRIYYLRSRKAMPVLIPISTYEDIKKRCAYLFKDKSSSISLTAQLEFKVIENARGSLEFLGSNIQFMQFTQAGMPVMGYRFGSFAYISDIRDYPETIFEDLAGVKVLVLSTMSRKASFMHLNIEEAIAFSQKAGAEKTYFTHMGHEIEYSAASASLPSGFYCAYDGLTVEFDYDG